MVFFFRIDSPGLHLFVGPNCGDVDGVTHTFVVNSVEEANSDFSIVLALLGGLFWKRDSVDGFDVELDGFCVFAFLGRCRCSAVR